MNQLRAELLKIRSTRTTIGLLAGLIVLALLFTILTCTLSPMSQLLTEQDQISLLSFGSATAVSSIRPWSVDTKRRRTRASRSAKASSFIAQSPGRNT